MFPNTNTKNTSCKKVKNQNVQNQNVQYDEALNSVLRRHDRNGDSVLSREELKKAFKDLGSNAPELRAIRALCHADKDRDGFIGEPELANLVEYAAKRGYVL